ncbi:hypothetical protein [Occallatibacter riparius]|uniref:Uncharacterized protein n=1 Tax=Occallatibacter riparius TaxID=1002689 RepID=A0A9J7BKD1_9BACT|nr:hypothetical protein MOP44_21425 [Occallatibacter riparius]
MASTGFTEVETCSIDHTGQFPSRESYWDAFDARQGSTFEYLSLLTSEQRIQLKESLLSSLPTEGPVTLKLRALAVRGRRQ